MSGLEWRVIALLVLLYVALYMNWSWPWGLLFVYWTVTSALSGETALVETVRRAEHPKLFWIVIVTWFLAGLSLILPDVAPSVVNSFYAMIWRLD